MLAEVADKIPSMADLWCLHAGVAAVAWVLSWVSTRRAALVILLPLAAAWAGLFIHAALLADGPLRESIVAELGTLAALMPIAAVLVGVLVARAPVINRSGFEVKLDTQQRK